MTATINDDCTLITIDSELFAPDNESVTLTLTHSGTEYEVTVEATNEDPVEVTAESLELEELPEGIYYVELSITNAANETTVESSCLASICSVHCDMVELYDDTANLEKILAYEGLKLAQGCVTCSCSVMQVLYDTITETDDTNCNCQ